MQGGRTPVIVHQLQLLTWAAEVRTWAGEKDFGRLLPIPFLLITLTTRWLRVPSLCGKKPGMRPSTRCYTWWANQ